MATKTLPKEVELYLDNSLLFNKFGIVNLNVIKGVSKQDLTKAELKKLVKARFAKEFVGTKIEFI